MMQEDEDPAYLRYQAQKAHKAQKEAESQLAADAIRREIKETPIHRRPYTEVQQPVGCGLFMIVALAWCLVGAVL